MNSKPTILLRRTRREGKRTKKKTIANLTSLPAEIIKLLKQALAGEKLVPINNIFSIVRSQQHGNVSAILSAMKKLRITNLLSSKPCKNARLTVLMIIARILHPSSKLEITRWKNDTSLAIKIPETGK